MFTPVNNESNGQCVDNARNSLIHLYLSPRILVIHMPRIGQEVVRPILSVVEISPAKSTNGPKQTKPVVFAFDKNTTIAQCRHIHVQG